VTVLEVEAIDFEKSHAICRPAVYAAAYLGVKIPVVVAGVIITYEGLIDTSIGYGIILAVIAASAIPAVLRTTAHRDDIRC
jgi:hypothetical protein